MSTSTLKGRLLTDYQGVGPNPRLRVDVAQTSFFAGREFRTYYELDMTGGETRIIKVVAGLDIILNDLMVNLVSGEVKIYTLLSDGTEGGTFGTDLPIIPTNTMSSAPDYSSQVSASTGGTYTGGTEIDLIWIKTSSNENKSFNNLAHVGTERGVAAATYYYKIEATGTTTGVFSARWEERPEGV